MASTSGNGCEVPKFDGNNFTLWKEMMQDVLVHRRQIEAIRHSKTLPGKTPEEWKSVNELARSTIQMHLAENVYFSIAKEKTTFDLWDKLQSLYEKKLSFSKLILIRHLFNMRMKETEEFTTHVNTFNHVLTELASQNVNFDKEVKALALFLSLPASWDVFCTTVTNGSAKLTLDDTLGQVLSEEVRRC